MKLLSSKRRLAAAAAVIVLMLFVLRPGASRLKSRIIASISAGVGRPVDLGSVHVRLLPRPGFDLENLVVYDDQAFGPEPMLRASEVTADLRLTSLLRGRIEIARLNLTEPSLNLVHEQGGRWNMEALLERTAHTPLAPTGNTKSAPRPRFPYIEGSSGRINFKSGPEKKAYAFINADFSLWQDSENSWGVRLKAQPLRTDLNLNDVGQLRVDGTWQRADSFKETPLKFDVEWTRAQLGQVTKFLSGNDKGWRGEIELIAALSGSPAQLKFTSTASIDDFRRYDITSGKALRLAAHCDGEYSTVSHEFHQVLCGAPVGSGLITLEGDVGLPGSGHYAVTVKAGNIPASAFVVLAERAKKNLPDDVLAEGTLRGRLSLQQEADSGLRSKFDGQGEITNFHLSSATTKGELGPTSVPFVITGGAERHGKFVSGNKSGIAVPAGASVEIGPIALNPARGGASARAWVNRNGYDITVAGESEISRMVRLGRMIGIPAAASTAEGSAQLNLQIAGSWSGAQTAAGMGFTGPQVVGTAKLRNVHVTPVGFSDPLQISSADMQLGADAVHVTKLSAKAAGTAWTGTLDLPRGCGSLGACAVKFMLNADEIEVGRMNEWVTGKKRPWYDVLQSSGKPGSSLLARLRASGHITANRFLVHGVVATAVTADVTMDAGKLQIKSLGGDVFGGKHQGKWLADFSVSPSVCKGSGVLTGVSLSKVAKQMGDDWIAGTARGSYEVAGPCTGEFWQSAAGTLQVDVKDGALPHVLLGTDTGVTISRLDGEARLREGTLEISSAKLDSPSGKYEIRGTASLQRDLNLRLTRTPADAAKSGYEITGTLSAPQVSSLSNAEQARLKPLPPK
ncbi:MAG: AsmA family protein [Candidatus Sulfotelmatobacter sp.]